MAESAMKQHVHRKRLVMILHVPMYQLPTKPKRIARMKPVLLFVPAPVAGVKASISIQFKLLFSFIKLLKKMFFLTDPNFFPHTSPTSGSLLK